MHVFSGNFFLYGDMSSRVMATLKAFSPILEVYSVDEAFLDLRSLPHHELFSYGCHIKKIVKQWTGIPVSVGIAPTKTLTKVANHLAKQHPSNCYTLLSPEKIEDVLRDFPLQDVWGIGRQWSKRLAAFNMNTALDLARADMNWIRKTFNVILARTALELRGIPCLKLEDMAPPKKSMISSRSFGTPVTSFDVLREAVSYHASRLAYKLREQESNASLLSVSIRTNPFDKKGRFYANTHLIPLGTPSQDTTVLIKTAASALRVIFREGLSYKKVGVMVLNLSPETYAPSYLFKEMEIEDSFKRHSLLQTIDKLNHKYGKGSLVFASEGVRKLWHPKSSWKSPSFTQSWNQLPLVR